MLWTIFTILIILWLLGVRLTLPLPRLLQFQWLVNDLPYAL